MFNLNLAGPKYWKKSYSDCSADSQQQSPIDIPKASGRTYDKSLKEMEFTNYDKVFKTKAKNDGYNSMYTKDTLLHVIISPCLWFLA